MDLAKVVTTGQVLPVERRHHRAGRDARVPARYGSRLHVMAYDYGVKRNILRMLADHGCRVTVVPGADTGGGRAWR
jgi:carbamoyl-phosphate synthase small subunit